MNYYVIVKKDKYRELCDDYLETKSKYKEALETIVELTRKLEAEKSRKKKYAGKTEPNKDC